MSSTERITIRPIKKKDFGQFFEVVRRAFDKEIEIMGLDLQRFARIVKFYGFIEVLSRALETVDVYVPTILVAESKEAGIVGGVHVVPYAKEVWTIDSLAVDPSYRQHGIGVHLISAALKYVEDRHGRKALTYVRVDNLPSIRIRKRLRGEFFDKRVFLMLNVNKSPNITAGDNSAVCEARLEDSADICRLCRTVDPKKAATFEISPKSFLNSKSELLMSGVGLTHRKKWVLKNRGVIVGYVDVIYSSPQEAAKIEHFCLVGASDPVSSAEQLLNTVFKTLAERKIRKLVVTLNEDWIEMIQIFEGLGFKRVASFYGVAHLLA